MDERWDVIIVGARCAGATLAALLAEAGVKTLVVEADRRGTDMPMSTHYLQPPGMRTLDRLGVGDRVRAVTPPTRKFRLALDETEAVAATPEGKPGYCVRRSTLDPLLQDAAERAGAELRFQHKVVELAREGERVVGVVVQAPGRERELLRADLVVGADGAHSTVARQVAAPEYLGEDSTRGGYFGYYRAPEEWPFAWDSTLEHRADTLRYVFRSDGGYALLVSVPPREEASTWGRAYREKLHASLLASPSTRVLAEGREPEGKVIGLLSARWFYRQPVGPGWALIGDAGHFKDFVTGQGMTDALFDAERFARAVLAPSREAAFEYFWRERDVETMSVHFDALKQGRVGYNNAFTRYVIGRTGRSPELMGRVSKVFDREITPQELVPFSRVLGWMGLALLQGRFDVLHGFLAEGKNQSIEKRELAKARQLLADADERLYTSKVPALTAGAPAVAT